MNILVLGASGMAGHLITYYLREHGHIVSTLCGTTSLDNESICLDLCNISKLKDYLSSYSFDVIINCAGMLVKNSDLYKPNAVFVNSYIPHFLSDLYKSTSTKIIHLSTDCVFSGKNPPYSENSICDGQLFYDRTKALGELNNSKDLTFRMSIIGPDCNKKGIGLFNWFMSNSGNIKGYTNVYWNGISTTTLARAITKAIDCDLSGLYHLVNPSHISKYDLINLFHKYFPNPNLSISPLEVDLIDKFLINSRTDFDFIIPNYSEMVIEIKNWIDNHSALYPHYFNRQHMYLSS